MKTDKISFISIANQLGIVCASNEDHTIYQLSREEPLAIAVNPNSPIPWDTIIDGYKRLGEPQHHDNFEKYAEDFEKYFSSLTLHLAPNALSEENDRIIFFGFGTEDIFPCIYDIVIIKNKKGAIEFRKKSYRQISTTTNAAINQIGDFESVSPLLYGITNDSTESLKKRQTELFNAYTERVLEKFRGTKYEIIIEERIAEFNAGQTIKKNIDEAIKEAYQQVKIGIDSFSIEDMADAAETLINANISLKHLRSGGKGELGTIRELAVITRTEGLTWIKHSLYTF